MYLSSSSPCYHRCSWMLNLHLMEQNIAVLGDLDVSGARHQHLHGALRTQVRLQNILKALGSTDVEGQGLSRAVDLGLWVEQADGGHLS